MEPRNLTKNLITVTLSATLILSSLSLANLQEISSQDETNSNNYSKAHTKVKQQQDSHELLARIADRTEDVNEMNETTNQPLDTRPIGNGIDDYELIQLYIQNLELAHGKMTIAQVNRVAAASKFKFANHLGLQRHKYDSYHELRASGGPKVNQELCLLQLQDLNRRALIQLRDKMQSKDINLYRLLDTFGQVPPGLTTSNLFWPGAYTKCKRIKIDAPSATGGRGARATQDTRYCWASLRFKSWPRVNDEFYDSQTVKAGVCIPRACDSLNYKNKYQLIGSLLELQNNKYVYQDELKLVDVYCLPDEDSPLRSWYLERQTFTLVMVSALWVAFLIYATVKSELAKVRGEEPTTLSSFSITTNLRRLFDCSEREKTIDNQQEDPKKPLVEFKVLDGFRVISTASIIVAHTLMCIPLISSNEQEATEIVSSPPFLIANLLPAFAVNTFFAITGLLTSYFAFKHNDKHPFMTNPLSWLALILKRYIRIMPTYVVVVAFLKYLAKFTGSGPFWDYGTSILGQRKKCEQESWLVTLLMGANLKPPLEQCVPSSWYLASDFQFLLVTPIFLITLLKMPEFGRFLLKLCIATGYLIGVVGIMLENTGNLTPTATFGIDGFKTYVTFLSVSYTQPHHRAPAYLLALLAGHTLYQMEKKSLAEGGQDQEQTKQINWSPGFKKWGKFLSLCFAWFIILLTPIVARRLPLNELGSKITVALSMPTYHLLYSAAVTVYILLASTGGGFKGVNKFLAAKFWKPLARVSLCIVLINIEVIDYMNQITTYTISLDSKNLAQSQLVSLLCAYFAAMVMFVTVEVPLKNLINLTTKRVGSCLVSSRKRKVN